MENEMIEAELHIAARVFNVRLGITREAHGSRIVSAPTALPFCSDKVGV
jgi:hypothetical protein